MVQIGIAVQANGIYQPSAPQSAINVHTIDFSQILKDSFILAALSIIELRGGHDGRVRETGPHGARACCGRRDSLSLVCGVLEDCMDDKGLVVNTIQSCVASHCSSSLTLRGASNLSKPWWPVSSRCSAGHLWPVVTLKKSTQLTIPHKITQCFAGFLTLLLSPALQREGQPFHPFHIRTSACRARFLDTADLGLQGSSSLVAGMPAKVP